MAFTVPNLDEMHAFLVALFKALFPEADVSQESFGWKWLKMLAAAAVDNHAHLRSVRSALLPTTAEGEDLEEWGGILNVTKKAATPARKANALRVFGASTSAVPIDQELTHASGLRFKTNEAAVIPAEGFIDVDVVAIDVGAATRLNKDEILSFTATPAGLEEQARLVLDMDEDGEDQEQDPAYRLRVLARLSDPPLGGARHDYEQWALEVTGIAAAFAYPLRQGLGSVDLAALHAGTGTARILSAGERDELQAYIDERRPVAVKAFRVLDVVPEPVDVEIEVLPNGEAQYEFDWDDSTPLTVAVWLSGPRELYFTTVRPDTMKAGDRIVIKTSAGDGTGESYVIESLGGLTDYVVLETAPVPAPAAGDIIYSGGPLTETVRSAVRGLIDGFGTANPDASRYGPWEGSLRPSAIARVAGSVDGVLDVDIAAPLASVSASDPPYPDNDEVGLLVPGELVVRRKH